MLDKGLRHGQDHLPSIVFFCDAGPNLDTPVARVYLEINKKINVGDMITHILRLDKIQEGFKIVASAKQNLKVVLLL